MSTVTTNRSTAAEQAAVSRVRTVSHLLDEAVRVPGTSFRIGIDPILGLIPVSGDFVAALLSLYIVIEGVRVGVSKWQIMTMLGLVAVEFAIGSIPVLGTVIDATWKINKRNAEVVASHIDGEV